MQSKFAILTNLGMMVNKSKTELIFMTNRKEEPTDLPTVRQDLIKV